MEGFSGFGPGTIRFLTNLGKNNNKAWFEKNRDAYEAHYVAPAKSFVSAAGDPLRKLVPEIHAEPRINGSIFRINRDIRFSADKTPYKDHIDIWFWEGDRKTAVSGFFFRLTAADMIVGTGAHRFDKARLVEWRKAVVAANAGDELRGIVGNLENSGFVASGQHYSRLPRGFQTDDPMCERLLRHNALWVSTQIPHPPETGSAALVDLCMEYWKKFAPLHRWLTATLSA